MSAFDRLSASARADAGRRGVVWLAGIGAGFPHSVVRAALAGHPGLMVHADWYWLSLDPSRLARIVGRLLTVLRTAAPGRGERRGGSGHPPPPDLDRRHPADVLAYLASQPTPRRAGEPDRAP